MSARDIIYIPVAIFALALGFFMLNFTSGQIADDLNSTSVISEHEYAVDSLDSIGTVGKRMDYVIFVFFIGLCLALIITGWFIGGHPLFMFVYFIVIVIGIIVSVLLSNFWETISEASVFGSTVNAFPITSNLMTNLPYYVLIIGFIGIVVMFGKPYAASRGWA